MPIPLRSLPFIHSTYTPTRTWTRKYTRSSSAFARRGPLDRHWLRDAPLCPSSNVSGERRDAIRPRRSHSTRPSSVSFPKYGISSQTPPRRTARGRLRRFYSSGRLCVSFDPNQLLLILLDFTEAAECGTGVSCAPASRFSTADSAARRGAPAQTQSMINPQKHQNTGGRLFGLPWHILSSREKIKKRSAGALHVTSGRAAAAAAAEITHGFFPS